MPVGVSRTMQLYLQISLTSIYELVHQSDIPIMASCFALATSQNLVWDEDALAGMPVVYIKHNNVTAATRTFKLGSKGEELIPELEIVSDNVFTKTKSNAPIDANLTTLELPVASSLFQSREGRSYRGG